MGSEGNQERGPQIALGRTSSAFLLCLALTWSGSLLGDQLCSQIPGHHTSDLIVNLPYRAAAGADPLGQGHQRLQREGAPDCLLRQNQLWVLGWERTTGGNVFMG